MPLKHGCDDHNYKKSSSIMKWTLVYAALAVALCFSSVDARSIASEGIEELADINLTGFQNIEQNKKRRQQKISSVL